MSSAANAITSVMPIMAQSTAAVNVSDLSDLRQKPSGQDADFMNILGKVSEVVTNAKTNNGGAGTGKTAQENKDVNAQPKEYASSLEQAQTAAQDDKGEAIDQSNAPEVTGEIATEDSQTQGKEASKELQEAILEDGNKLIAEIADELEMSEEDIIKAMEVLGLTVADLLIPENLQQLVVTSASPETVVELITDSDLYTSLQDLIEDADSMGSELMKEFDLTEEEFKTAIDITHEDFSAKLKGESKETNEVVAPIMEEDMEPEPTVDVTVKGKLQNVSKVTYEEDVDHDFKPIENSHETDQQNNNNAMNKQSATESLFGQFIRNVTDTITGDLEVMNMDVYEQRAQMENIIRQITEKITISAQEDVTQMELTLHPASLGNVNILLTHSKEGIVAKFTAQNELVKEAVESQMVMLQQKFEQNGIKVTSVEVTIASHGFEENLDKGAKEQAQEENAKPKKNLRRINLSALEDIDEDLDESDKLSAEMMAMSGNTVDFSA